LRKAGEPFKQQEIYARTLAEYSEEHGTTPYEVLSNPEQKLEVIETAFGSLDTYVEIETKRAEKFEERSVQAKKGREMTSRLAQIAPMFVNSEDLDKYGVDLELLITTLQDQVTDATKFGEAFLKFYAEIVQDDLQELRSLKTEE
jgi:hypothetical protein